jgi:hypothetical protein
LVLHVKLVPLLDVQQPQIPFSNILIYTVNIWSHFIHFKVTLFLVLVSFCVLIL